MASSYSGIGFIGLGTMGYPMVENLVKKLPPSVQVYVFDVVNDSMMKLASENKDKVYACRHPKEVANNSVRKIHPTINELKLIQI